MSSIDQPAIDAVFENGAFRPLDPRHVPVREGEHVRLRLEEPAASTSLELASQVYEGLSAAEIDEIERIALEGNSFFDGRETS